jgi:hypothetical protein
MLAQRSLGVRRRDDVEPTSRRRVYDVALVSVSRGKLTAGRRYVHRTVYYPVYRQAVSTVVLLANLVIWCKSQITVRPTFSSHLLYA